jgi:hypothetical protein
MSTWATFGYEENERREVTWWNRLDNQSKGCDSFLVPTNTRVDGSTRKGALVLHVSKSIEKRKRENEYKGVTEASY